MSNVRKGSLLALAVALVFNCKQMGRVAAAAALSLFILWPSKLSALSECDVCLPPSPPTYTRMVRAMTINLSSTDWTAAATVHGRHFSHYGREMGVGRAVPKVVLCELCQCLPFHAWLTGFIQNGLRFFRHYTDMRLNRARAFSPQIYHSYSSWVEGTP